VHQCARSHKLQPDSPSAPEHMLRRTHLLAKHLSPSSNISNLAKMSTFTLPDTAVTVTLRDDLTKEQLLGFPAFKVTSHLPRQDLQANNIPRTGSKPSNPTSTNSTQTPNTPSITHPTPSAPSTSNPSTASAAAVSASSSSPPSSPTTKMRPSPARSSYAVHQSA
jgi:cell division septation protein DedD